MALKRSSTPTSSNTIDHDESTPLIQRDHAKHPVWPASVVYRVLFTSFLVSASFGVTQVPIIYIFGLMTCDEYYKTHADPGPGVDRCKIPTIEAGTARAVALMGGSTTFFGVINLFFTGWAMKAFGIKKALLVSVFWPSIRLLIQNIGVELGAGLGILILQLSQIMTIIGGPAGYVLALSAYATEVVTPSERTGTFGRLQGCAMFGTSAGFLAGGLIGDIFNIKMPFRVTLALFLISSIWTFIFLPEVGTLDPKQQSKAATSISALFEPIKTFTPIRWRLKNGKVQKEYGLLLLGIGIFIGLLATTYTPTLLQMYGTNIFSFGTTENGWLISANSAVRGLFMTVVFAPMIKHGRKWTDSRQHNDGLESSTAESESLVPSDSQIDADQVAPAAAQNGEPEPIIPPEHALEETFAFDLFYTRWSLLLDGILTGLATFITQGWQMYLIAVIIPLAAGTGSAAKGTVLQMCPPNQRTDALSAISLIELMARLSTTALFGVIFAAFADIRKTYLIFPCVAAIATLGFIVLMFARFPPTGSTRHIEDENNEVSEQSADQS